MLNCIRVPLGPWRLKMALKSTMAAALLLLPKDVLATTQASCSECWVVPPAYAVKQHKILPHSSAEYTDFLIDDFRVIGDCGAVKYQTSVTSPSSAEASWLELLDKGVRVPPQTDPALRGDYTVAVTATDSCDRQVIGQFTLSVSKSKR